MVPSGEEGVVGNIQDALLHGAVGEGVDWRTLRILDYTLEWEYEPDDGMLFGGTLKLGNG